MNKNNIVMTCQLVGLPPKYYVKRELRAQQLTGKSSDCC